MEAGADSGTETGVGGACGVCGVRGACGVCARGGSRARGRYTACGGSATPASSWLGRLASGAYLEDPTYLHTVGGLNTYDQSCD